MHIHAQLPLKATPIPIHARDGIPHTGIHPLYIYNVDGSESYVCIVGHNPRDNLEQLDTLLDHTQADTYDLFLYSIHDGHTPHLCRIHIHKGSRGYHYEMSPWRTREDHQILTLLLEVGISNAPPHHNPTDACIICVDTIGMLHRQDIRKHRSALQQHSDLLSHITTANTQEPPSLTIPPYMAIPGNTQQQRLVACAEQGINARWISTPGAGTTRTIVNLIASSLHHERSVLYVSNHTDRRHYIEQWFDTPRPSKDTSTATNPEEEYAIQVRRNARIELEHTTRIFKEQSTLWYQIGQALERPTTPKQHIKIWTKGTPPSHTDITNIDRFIEELIRKPTSTTHIGDESVYHDIRKEHWSIQWQHLLTKAIEGLGSSQQSIEQNLTHIYTLWNIPTDTPIQKSMEFIQHIQKTPDPNTQWYCGPSWHDIESAVHSIQQNILELRTLRQMLVLEWIEPFHAIPATTIIKEHQEQAGWKKMIQGSTIVRMTDAYRTTPTKDEDAILADLRTIDRIQAIDRMIDRFPYATILGPLWDKALTQYKHIQVCLDWGKAMLRMWGALTNKKIYNGPQQWDTNMESNRAWQISQWYSQQRQYEQEIKGHIALPSRTPLPPMHTMRAWIEHPDQVRQRCEYNIIHRMAERYGMTHLLEHGTQDPYSLRSQWAHEALQYTLNTIPYTPFHDTTHIPPEQADITHPADDIHTQWTTARHAQRATIASPYELYNLPLQLYDTVILEDNTPNLTLLQAMPILGRGNHAIIIQDPCPRTVGHVPDGRQAPLDAVLDAHGIMDIRADWIYPTLAAQRTRAPYTLPLPNERKTTRVQRIHTGYTDQHINWAESMHVIHTLKRFQRIRKYPTVYTLTPAQATHILSMMSVEGLHNPVRCIGHDPMDIHEHIIISGTLDDAHMTDTDAQRMIYASSYASQQLDIIHSLTQGFLDTHPAIHAWEQGCQGPITAPPSIYTTTHWLANQLVNHGWSIDTHLGQAGCNINIAVRHPKYPRAYVLAILCQDMDKIPYAPSQAYDHIQEKQAILHHHGWETIFIPIMACYHQPNSVIQAIEARIERAMQ